MRTPTDEQQSSVPQEGENSPAIDTGLVPTRDKMPPQISALTASAHFLRDSWIRVLTISAVMLVPCFWHKRIEAGDLASHTYNAWLSQLIERGQAPGLWLANQWNNVLFDESLSRLGNLVGLRLAEKICVSAAVLMFFWGAFAMVAAITRRTPWSLVPLMAMVAYGWTFQQGFLNFYISLAIAFFGVALLHGGKGLEGALILVMLPVIWMAHPLGVALLLGLGFYVVIATKLRMRGQLMLFGGTAFLMLATSVYLSSCCSAIWPKERSLQMLFAHNGADQLVLYGARYRLPSILVIAFVVFDVVLNMRRLRTQEEPWTIYFLPLQLYGLALLAGALLPTAIMLPGYTAPLSLLTDRLTSVTAVLACCLLATARPQKWRFPCLAVIAAVFFVFLYNDTEKLNRMEQQAEQYERALPPGQRIIATIWPFVGSRLLFDHIVDRACIGQCFSYGNYEPPSGQFRVRAKPGNPYVLAAYADADEVESGNYIVRARDLPIFEIYQCGLNMTELCMRELAAGDRNGSEGVHPVVQNSHISDGPVPVR